MGIFPAGNSGRMPRWGTGLGDSILVVGAFAVGGLIEPIALGELGFFSRPFYLREDIWPRKCVTKYRRNAVVLTFGSMNYFVRRHHRARIVRDAIRSAVVEGVWASGVLPAEDELGRGFGVGRNVIREALQLLVAEGLLVRQQGSGTRPARQVLQHEMTALRSLYEGRGPTSPVHEIRHLVLRWAVMPASPIHAASLGLGAGDPVIHYERLTLSATPLILWSTVMRGDLGLEPPVGPGELAAEGFYAYLERSGLALGRGSVRTSAVRADPGVAELLEMEVGSPVLLRHRRLLLSDGRPLEVSTGYFRPDQIALFHDVSR
jgi:GntR family transcriptional regulator